MVQEAFREFHCRCRMLLDVETRDVSQKEERAHDEKVASANGKIKQAGLNYEKRVKKRYGGWSPKRRFSDGNG